ncbi:MAG: glycosyltransferase family 1 protein [Halioglobus sp.]
MESRNENQPLSGLESQLLQTLQSQPYLLMVGTIEPRKGHEQVLNAMELLWSQGYKLSLVVVGSIGWVSEDFADRLKRTSRDTSSFCLLNYVSDSMLQSLYQNAAGTMMASLGEGFGLPLIEAANYGSPLLARDLPVFREVCGDAAWYFHSTDGRELAGELTQWLKLYETASLPDSSRLHWKSWAQSAEELTGNIIHQKWYLD